MVIENYVIDNRLSSNNYLIFQYVKELELPAFSNKLLAFSRSDVRGFEPLNRLYGYICMKELFVEDNGFKPLTPCVQSRCSIS